MGIRLEICLFGPTIKQLLSNFEPWKPLKYKNFEKVAYKRSVLSTIEAINLREY